MPELPEVQNVVDTLNSQIAGKSILSVDIKPLGERLILPYSIADTREQLLNRKITSLDRIGKFIIFNLADTEQKVVAHLRMTGSFIFYDSHEYAGVNSKSPSANLKPNVISEGVKDKYTRLVITMENGMLKFEDKRRFATFHLVNSLHEYPGVQRLGPDALDGKFTPEYLYNAIKHRTKPIYSSLMDQTIMAGLGNIYVNEALALAQLLPTRSSSSISMLEAETLHDKVIQVLNKAIKYKGTTLLDYQNSRGEQGNFQNELIVYGKKITVIDGKEYSVNKTKIAGRSVFFVPNLQR